MAIQNRGGGSHVRLWVMLFLCALSFLTYYDRQCIVRAQERIQESLALDDKKMGIVFGAFWLAYALFEIPSGWLGDRFGARLTITRIVLAWSLFTMLTGAATGFYSLLVCRFLFGAGEAGAYPNMARIQSRWLPIAERARAGGVLWLMARWGAAFAPKIFGVVTRGFASLQAGMGGSTIGGWLASIADWRAGFFVSGLAGIAWCLAFYPWFRDEPAQKNSVSAAERQFIESGRGEIENSHTYDARIWRMLFSSPSLWAIALYYFCGSFGWSFFVSWMPKYLDKVQHVPFEDSEWTTAFPLVCGGIACFAGGVFSDALVKRTGRRRLGRAIFPVTGCLIAAAAMVAIRHAESARTATILMCVASAAFDFGQAATWASIVDIGGRNAGIAMGFINTVGNMAHAVQPYVGANVFDELGWNALFGLYAVAYLLASITWIVIDPTKTFYRERQES
jgi:MFS transporter, ACS family, glucarate transporter